MLWFFLFFELLIIYEILMVWYANASENVKKLQKLSQMNYR